MRAAAPLQAGPLLETCRSQWCRALSSEEDLEKALTELLTRWTTSLPPAVSGLQPGVKLTAGACAPLAQVQELWRKWRSGSLGDIPLWTAVALTADGSMREAFKLIPEEMDLVYPGWRDALRWELEDRDLPDDAWRLSMRAGAVAAEIRRAAKSLQGREPKQAAAVPDGALAPGFALLFVPARWAEHFEATCRRIEEAIGWPAEAPFVAVLHEGRSLTLSAAFMPPEVASRVSPCSFDSRAVDEAGAEGYRLQEDLYNGTSPRSYYTEYYRQHGRTNGTVVACRQILGRKSEDVGSALLFADPAAGELTHRKVLSLLDGAFPNAVKAGVVAAAAADAPGQSLYLGGRRAGLRCGGVIGVLLPGRADTATTLCGCEPVGPLWEIHEVQKAKGASIIQILSDPTSLERDADGRRLGLRAGPALRGAAAAAGYGEGEDLWIGLPRVHKRDKKAAAPGIGEWVLLRASSTTAEGSLVLEGELPGREGEGGALLGGTTVSRLQAFRLRADYEALGRMSMAYNLERRICRESETVTPFATLVFGGGEGAALSLADDSLHDGTCLGTAVLGAPGVNMLEVSAEDALRDCGIDGPPPKRATLVHRQAAGLVMLF